MENLEYKVPDLTY